MKRTSTYVRIGARLLGAAFGLVAWGAAHAQVPGVTPEPMAGQELLGEQYCFEAPWTNSGDPGYGPYLRLLLPPELTFDSAELFGSGLTVVTNAVLPAPPGSVTDPLFLPAGAPGSQIVAPDASGWRVVILELPVGSVVAHGPEMSTTLCVTTNNAPPNLANVGQAYPIHITPVYRYGDSATGNSSEVGAQQSPTVTPQVLLFEKDNTAPEHERPPGQIWPYEYVLSVNIAAGAMIEPLEIADTLPANVQYVPGSIQIGGAAFAGSGCAVVTEPGPGPGGQVLVRCENGALIGESADEDIVVTFEVYVLDILDEGTCGTQLLTNQATVNANYQPAGGGTVVLDELEDESDVTAKHVAIQKSANQYRGRPDTEVTYTLNLQTTEHGVTDALVVLDTLHDGVEYNGAAPRVYFNGVEVLPVSATHYTYTSGVGDDTLEIDVHAIYAAAHAGADIPAGTAIQISYLADIQQNYEVTGEPVLAADPLNNNVVATYGLTDGAAGCADTSAATVTIDPVEIRKELIQPVPGPGTFVVPGDVVVFRLTMEIPSGDTKGVVFYDYFPLPVFDVTTIIPATDVVLSPVDTFGVNPSLITPHAATNSLEIRFPDISTATPVTVSVDISITVQPDAFADNLFLTNIFRAESSNTPGDEAAGETPVQIHVRAPALTMTKGVFSTNGTGTIAPVVDPVDGDLTDADAGDQVVYRLTVQNTGGASAYGLIVTDTVPAGLTCLPAGVTAQRADGTALTMVGNLFSPTGVTLSIGGNANTPVLLADGAAPAGSDTAYIDVTCTIDANALPGSTLENTAGVTWLPFPDGERFPEVTDDATVTIRNVELNKSIVASSEAASTTPADVLIGEIVRYRLVVNLPEGQIPNMRVVDVLPTGMQYLENTAGIAFVSNGAGITSSGVVGAQVVTGDAPGAAASPLAFLPGLSVASGSNCDGAAFGNGTPVCFLLGNVANNNRDDDHEFIVIEFNALVLNVPTNGAGTALTNTFQVRSGVDTLGTSAPVTVNTRLPNVTVAKSVNPDAGVQAGDTVVYTLVISNAAGAMPAYDVAVNDVLPSQLQLDVGSVTPASAGSASAFVNTSAVNTVSGTIDVIPAGGSVTITYEALVLVAAAPGQAIVNAVTGTWTSLPGGQGTPPSNPGNGTGSQTPGNSDDQNGERGFTGTDNAPIGVQPVTLGKAVVATSQDFTGNGEHTAEPDLVIGETATFRITATIPEGTAPNFTITDIVPSTAAGRMHVESAQYISASAWLQFPDLANDPSTVLIQIDNDLLGDAYDDTVVFTFGEVINTPSSNGSGIVVVEVVARLIDHDSNTNGDTLTNNVSVDFGSGTNGTAHASVDVVEPRLVIVKDSPKTSGQAGETANFTVTVSHHADSTAEAQAVRITDTLPSPAGLENLTSVAAVLTGADCVVPPLATLPVITNNTVGDSLDISVDILPLECGLEITYTATLQNDVVVNTPVTNTANVVWYSINPDDADDGDEGREYDGSDTHSILISSPGLNKWVESVAPDVGSGQVVPANPDASIGAEVTYQFTVEFPAGVSPNAVVADQLPTGGNITMNVLSSRVVSMTNGAFSNPGNLAVNLAGTPSDTDLDGFNDLVTWSLGNVSVLPSATAAQRTVTFEVVARVEGGAGTDTAGGNTVTNVASFDADTLPDPLTDPAPLDIVEPVLVVEKDLTLRNGAPIGGADLVQAGDVLTFEVEVRHTGASTADAFNVQVVDTLPSPGLTFGAQVLPHDANCGTSAPTVNAVGQVITFTLQPVPAGALPLGTACTITYTATVSDDVNPGYTYRNSVVATYTTLEDPDAPGGRDKTTAPDNDSFTILAPSLVKSVTDSSLTQTGSAAHDDVLVDLAIGELVTYTLTIVIPQGTTENSVLLDTLPAGLRPVGAQLELLGNSGITTGYVAPPVIDVANNTVEFDFDTIVNPANGVDDDDWIRVSVTAVVLDVPGNVDGEELINNATFTYDTVDDLGNPTPGVVDDDATVEVVEPELTLNKTMSHAPAPGVVGDVSIALEICNVGTGPAFGIVVEDVFSNDEWANVAITPANTPAGFSAEVLANTPADHTTVRLTSTAPLMAGNTCVTATITASVQFPLLNNPVQNTARIPTHITVPYDPTNPGDPDDNCEDSQFCRDYDEVEGDDELGYPEPEVTKTVANIGTGSGPAGEFVPGDRVIFNITVTNVGPAVLTGATLTDVVPVNTTFSATGSHADWTCADGAPAATNCALSTPFNVPANGGTVVRAFAVEIDDPLPANFYTAAPDGFGGVIANQALLTSPDLPPDTTVPSDDPDTPEEPDPTDVPVLASPELTLTKVDDVDEGAGEFVVPGDTIIYTLAYENIGNQHATGVVITETVPLHTTFTTVGSTAGWSCIPAAGAAGADCELTIGNLAVGANGSVTFAVVVDDPLAPGVSQIFNTAVIEDDDDNTDSDNETTPLEGTPGMGLSKTANVVETVPGGIVIYTLTYWNSGDQDVANPLITETVPANATFHAAGSTPGWSCADGAPAATSCVLDIGPQLPGQTTSVTPAGTALFAVQVNNPLPAGVDQIHNAAVLSGDGETDVTDDEDTPVNAVPDLGISKTDGDIQVGPGDVLSYTLRYWNEGNQGATGVVISEIVPPNTTFAAGYSTLGWSCADGALAGTLCQFTLGAVAAGSTAAVPAGSVMFSVNIPNPIPAGWENVLNEVIIGDDGTNGDDPNPDNNEDDETTPVNALPDLTITKVAGAASVGAGDVLVYTLSYQNVGNQNASGVEITEAVPANTTFNAGASAPGWSCADGAPAGTACVLLVAGDVVAGAAAVDVSFAVNIPDPIPAGLENVVNAVSIGDDGAGGDDPTPENNSDDEDTPVDAVPRLVVTKDDGVADPVAPGDVISYQVTYQNIGDQNASGVVLTEVVPEHTTYTGSGWNCAPDNNAGSTCSYVVSGDVVAGADVVTVVFAVTVDSPLPAGVEEVANRVTIHSDGDGGEPDQPPPGPNEPGYDPNDERNDEETTPVDAVPDLVIRKRANGALATVNSLLGFTLTYWNEGSQDATGVVITETVPDGSVFNDAGSTPGWTCADASPAGTVCEWHVGDLAADSVQHEVVFAVVVTGTGGVVNSVRIDDDGNNGDDATPPNNEDQVVVHGTPVWVPVGSPWALILLALALGGLAFRQRRRFN